MNVLKPPALKITNSRKNEEQNEDSFQRRFKSVHFNNRDSTLASNGEKKTVFIKKNTFELDSLQNNQTLYKMNSILDDESNEEDGEDEKSKRLSKFLFYGNSSKNKKKSVSLPGKPRTSVYNRFKKKQSLKLSNEEDFKVTKWVVNLIFI